MPGRRGSRRRWGARLRHRGAPTPGATTPVTVSFIAKQSPDPGTAWYGVEVTSTTRNRSCEHSEDAQVAPAQAGKRVNVTLRPVDKRR
jgi:hypothetical protein